MTLTCPDHGSVEPRLAWCESEGMGYTRKLWPSHAAHRSKLHLGGRCPVCNLWLKWLACWDMASPVVMGLPVEALR